MSGVVQAPFVEPQPVLVFNSGEISPESLERLRRLLDRTRRRSEIESEE